MRATAGRAGGTGAAIRVLLADDHALFREGMRALMASLETVEVIGEAETGAKALQLALELRPDVVLMDIQMPDMNGIEATRRLVEASPDTRVIMLTMYQDDESVFAAMRAGARGYVLKGARQQELMRAVQTAAGGGALFSPGIAERILVFFQTSRRDLPLNVFPDLTEREREVLDLIAGGMGNSDIARRLGISGKTVRNHVTNIFSKLHVTDRAQAVVRARKAGFGGDGPDA